MAAPVIWSCIICGFKADERPPRHCPNCGVSASKFRMIVDRDPEPQPKQEPIKDEPEALAS